MEDNFDSTASAGENRYSDTRGLAGEPVLFTKAVIDGLAHGGGLYVPARVPSLSLDDICGLAELPYAKRAAAIYRAFGVDLPAETVDSLMEGAYGKQFDSEDICPITSLDERTHVLELWHGPTSAFKDMALQCLPRFFSASAEVLRERLPHPGGNFGRHGQGRARRLQERRARAHRRAVPRWRRE